MTSTQKIIKYFAYLLATFIICLIASSLIGTISFISMLFGYSENRSDITETVKTDYTDMKYLDIDLESTNLEIKEGEEFKIETTDKENLYISNLSSTVKIKDRDKNHFFWHNNKNSIKIYIPKNTVEKLKLDVGAGKVTINNIDANSIKLEHGAGYVLIKDSEFKKADIEGGAGKLEINSSTIHNLSFETGVGNSSITSSQILGKSNIAVGVGNVSVGLEGSKEDYTLYAEKGIGSIKIDGEKISGKTGTGDNEIHIEGGIGNIDVYFQQKN